MRLAACATLLVITAACIPGRDNPNDPKNSPEARLAVSPAEGRVSEEFLLDASASSGGLGTRHYRWDLDGLPGYEFPPGGTTLSSSLAWTFNDLPADAFGIAGAGTYEREIGVSVESSGAGSTARLRVVLRNAAPVLDVGPELVVAPWTGATVVLEPCAGVTPCPSFDVDGPLGVEWSWKQIPTETVTLTITSGGRMASFTAPEDPQTLYFEATVTDGFATRRDTRRVRVGASVWVSMGNPNRTFRFHPELVELEPLAAGYPDYTDSGFHIESSGDVWILAGDVDTALFSVFHRALDGSTTGIWDLPATHLGGGAIVPSGDGGACITAPRFDSTGTDVFRLLPPALAATSGSMVLVTTDAGTAKTVLERATGQPAGDCRAVSDAGVFTVHADGSTTSLFAADFSELVSEYPEDEFIATRDGAIWRWIRKSSPDESVLSAVARYGTAGTADFTVDFAVDGNSLGVVAVSGEDLLFVGRPPTGDLRASEISAAGVVTSVVFPPTPVLAYSRDIISVPLDRAVWVSSPYEAVLRRLERTEAGWEVAGEVFSEDLPTPSQSVHVIIADPSTGGILAESYELGTGDRRLVRVPPALRAFEPIPIASINPLVVAVSAIDGTAWTRTVGDYVRRLDSLGREAARVAIAEDEYFIEYFSNRAGGIWLLVDPADGAEVVPHTVREVDASGAPTGAPPLTFPGEKSLASIAIGTDGAPRCAGQKDFFGIADLFLITGTTFVPVETVTDASYMEAAANGDCWFLARNGFDDVLIHADGSGYSMIPLLGTGRMVADPRPTDGGLWIFEGSNLRHVAATGVKGAPILNLATPGAENRPLRVERRCPPNDDRDTCVLLWVADGPMLRRVSADGVEVAPLPFPFGSVSDLSIAR